MLDRLRRARRPLASHAVPAALLAASLSIGIAPPGRADIDVEIRSGDRVDGTLSPGTESETFRAFVPKDARLSVAAKGRKAKGTAGVPTVDFRLIGPGDAEVGSGAIVRAGKGARLASLPVAASGEHRVVVTGDGTSGDYQLTVKWKSRGRSVVPGTLADVPVEVAFDADRGATASFDVRPAKGSAARPRLAEVRDAEGGVATTFTAPAADAASHRVKNVPLRAGGAYRLVVTDAGGGGDFTATISVRAPAASKRKIGLTTRQIGAADGASDATGAVIGPEGGELTADGVASLDGVSVSVPALALPTPTAIVIGTSPDLQAKGLTGAGPTVFLGPEGLRFKPPGGAVVTIPFDVAAFGGDTSSLRVLTRDARGKVTEISDLTIDLDAGTVSFPVAHFSSFRVFRKAATPTVREPPADLDGDGIDDLVVPAPKEQVTDRGSVYVFFGRKSFESATADDADAVFTGESSGDTFGEAVATGDVNGDGHADLVVSAAERGDGVVYLFLGGPQFAGRSASQATAVYTADAGHRRFGSALAVGDVNGDGKDDVIVGASETASFAGAVFVFFGEATPAAATSSAADAVFQGESGGDTFGTSVATGDVTGDGVRDLLVGAPQEESAAFGRAYVFAGSAGFESVPASEALAVFTNDEGEDASFGAAVAAGDVDGDGRADVFVAAPGLLSGDPEYVGGAVAVFRGGPGLAGRDVSAADHVVRGDFVNDGFGRDLAAADVDGDGDAELIAGARGDDTLFSAAGAVHVFGLGGGFGPETQDEGRKTVGFSGFLLLGAVLRPVDVNDDGHLDVVFAAPRHDDEFLNSGAVYVVTGAHSGNIPPTETTVPIVLTGGRNNVFLGGF